VLTLIVAGCGRAILFQGVFRELRIASGSMAPSHRGPHYAWRCVDCSAFFACDHGQWPGNDIIVCPHCGNRENSRDESQLQPGQRVYIDRFPFFVRDPRRGEVVAFQAGENGWEVKRVIGLPGEKIGIRGGDIWIDGRRRTKSLDEFDETAILVNDAAFPAKRSKLPPRWRSKSNNWKRTADALFQWNDSPPEIDWLTYHHRSGSLSPRAAGLPAPVVDIYGENQNVARPLFLIRDLVLKVTVTADESYQMRVENGLRSIHAECRLDDRRLLLQIDGASHEIPLPSGGTRWVWRLGFIDHQAVVELNGREIFRTALATLSESKTEKFSTTPAAVGASEGSLTLHELQLWRDIYRLDPEGIGRPWQHPQLESHQFLVLGDNAPISMDSRMRGPIRRNLLAGKVLRAR
jgi:signal peptidase I